MLNQTFKNEGGVREWMKRTHGRERLFWHEAAAGGTSGYPDCELVVHSSYGGILVPVELKCDVMTTHQGMFVYSPKLRPGQMEAARRLFKLGVFSLIAVGWEGKGLVGLGCLDVAEEAQRNGNGTLLHPVDSVSNWHLAAEGLRLGFVQRQREKPTT